MSTSTERRQYYRINDVVSLHYEIISAGEAGSSGTDTTLQLSTLDLLREIDREFNHTVNLLWGDSPATARALGLLNRKISLVAATVLDGDDQNALSYDRLKVNLSGCGIAFESGQALPPGARLALHVILHPSQVNLTVRGTVVACEALPASSAPYWIRVRFDDDAGAREEFIRHVVQKQGALLEEEGAGLGTGMDADPTTGG